MGPDLPPGSEIGGYRIEGLIGRGGMGVVYLAEHIRLAKKVALKVLAPELADDETFRERFLRECRTAAALDHPNIVDVQHADESEGYLFIAMRFVPGRDLGQLLSDEAPLDPYRTIRLLEQAASALDAAHEAGLIHRDVKPGNMLVSDAARAGSNDEHLYLTDFGLTKRQDSDTALTKTGYFMGTLNYAAPEQIAGSKLTDRIDQYALGCVAFQCLSGASPYAADSDAQVLGGHLFAAIPSLSARRMDLPEGVDDVMNKVLAKEPQDRFETCLTFVSALEATLPARRTSIPESPAVGIPQTIVLPPSALPVEIRLGESEVVSPRREMAAPSASAPAEVSTAVGERSAEAPPVSPIESVPLAPVGPSTPAPVAPPPFPPAEPAEPAGRSPLVLVGIVIAVALVVGGVVFALTRGGGEAAAPGPSASGGPVSTPPPPLTEARLSGSFRASMTIASSTFQPDGAHRSDSFRFSPSCASGPCSASWSDTTFSGASASLSRGGGTYSGSDATPQPFGSFCGAKTDPSQMSITLDVTEAGVVDGEWRATSISGTIAETVLPTTGCSGGRQTWSFTATLR